MRNVVLVRRSDYEPQHGERREVGHLWLTGGEIVPYFANPAERSLLMRTHLETAIHIQSSFISLLVLVPLLWD